MLPKKTKVALAFTPKLGEAKPHLSHEEMQKLPKAEHNRLLAKHITLAKTAVSTGNVVALKKHQDAAAMHNSYAEALKPKDKKAFLDFAKKLYDKLNS